MVLSLTSHAATETIVSVIPSGVDGAGQLTKALDAIREHTRDLSQDLVIELQDGTLYLDKPLSLDATHSGSNGHYVVFRAAAGAKPVLSRGQRIGGWKQHENGKWYAPLNGHSVRQVFVNHKRAQRARSAFPEGAERYGDLTRIDSDAGYLVPNAMMSQWLHPDRIELGFFNSWSHMTCRVTGISLADSKARIRMHMPTFMLGSRKEGVRMEMPAYMENAYELLDEPGEWYADPENDKLYYKPREGEDLNSANVMVTGDVALLAIRGTADARAHHIRFEGIAFAEAASEADVNGLADVQANFSITAENVYERDGYLVNVHNEYRKPPAAITIDAANDVVFDSCTFTRIGGAAINIEAATRANGIAARDVTIRNCAFFDIGGSAIQIGDVGRYAHHPVSEDQIVRNNRVENCNIYNIGAEYEGSVGIFVGYTQSTVIEGNHIHDLPYSGISIGWGWGEEDAGGSTYPIPFVYESPTPARDNRIANNHIHNVMQKRLDGGGVYTLGNMPGTVIEGNHIHDNPGWPGGIYLDEGSGFIEVRHNKVYNVPTPMNFNNRNQNRFDTCNVHDNEFAEKKE
jgi:hypothetical protein